MFARYGGGLFTELVKCNAIAQLADSTLTCLLRLLSLKAPVQTNLVAPDRLNLYIYDSKTTLTRSPFTLGDATYSERLDSSRLLPVYGISQQNEPRLLVIDCDFTLKTFQIIDLHALGSTPQSLAEFGLQLRIPLDEMHNPSCRTGDEERKLVIAGVASGVIDFSVIALSFVWRWRKRRSK